MAIGDLSFAFRPDAGESADSVARKRALAEALFAGGMRAPRDVGEGLTTIGQALAFRMMNAKADKAEAAGRASAKGPMAAIMAALSGGFPAAPSGAPMMADGGGSREGPPPKAPPPPPNVASVDPLTEEAATGVIPQEVAAPTGMAYTAVPEAGKGWTVLEGPNGTVRREGSRNWRNNNPGNIEYGPFAKNAGAIGTDGRFAVFPTYEAGRAAKAKLLFESPNYRDKTIAGAINRYAPPFENNTNAYTGAVAQAIGVDPNTPIAALSPQQREAMLDAMERVEGFKVGREIALSGAPQVPPAVAAVNAMAEPTSQPIAMPDGSIPGGQVPPPILAAPGAVPTPDAITAIPPNANPRPDAITASPVQLAQAAPQTMTDAMPEMAGNAAPIPQGGPSMQMLLEAAGNEFLPPQQRAIVNALLQREFAKNDPMARMEQEKAAIELERLRNPPAQRKFITGKDGSIFLGDETSGDVRQVYGGKPDKPTDVQEYEYYAEGERAAGRQPLGPLEYQQALRKSGASNTEVNIDQRAEGAFEKKSAEGQAEAFNTMATAGRDAVADLGVIDELETLLGQNGGVTAGLSGWLAQRGIGVEGASDLQAAQALINKLVPTMRQPGSGTMSDRDVELFTRSLPSLWNQPGGNAKIIKVMRGLAQYKQAQGDIAARALTGDISRQEATKLLQALPNPLAGIEKVAPEVAAPKPGDTPPPQGVDPKDWEFMTPEERKLFQ